MKHNGWKAAYLFKEYKKESEAAENRHGEKVLAKILSHTLSWSMPSVLNIRNFELNDGDLGHA